MSHAVPFADEIMLTVSNFSQLEWLKRLTLAPQAAPKSRWSRYVESAA
jgi:hypothetical protein